MSIYFGNTAEEDEVVEEPEYVTVPTTAQTDDERQMEAHQALSVFWTKVNEEIKKIKTMDLKVQALPLARIKKIMKLDEDVKMISAEAPILFAKAAEIFIHELTLRAWVHTEDNKRRTLQRNDIAMAITKYDQFDFLIDIVPRDDVKPTVSQSVKTETNPTRANSQDQVQYYFQLAQQHQQALQGTSSEATSSQQQAVTTASNLPSGAVIQVPNQAASQQPGNIQIVHQIVTPSGEVQNIPANLAATSQRIFQPPTDKEVVIQLQLNQQQLQLIRMQLQNSSNQPVILQSTVGQSGNGNSIIQMQ